MTSTLQWGPKQSRIERTATLTVVPHRLLVLAAEFLSTAAELVAWFSCCSGVRAAQQLPTADSLWALVYRRDFEEESLLNPAIRSLPLWRDRYQERVRVFANWYRGRCRQNLLTFAKPIQAPLGNMSKDDMLTVWDQRLYISNREDGWSQMAPCDAAYDLVTRSPVAAWTLNQPWSAPLGVYSTGARCLVACVRSLGRDRPRVSVVDLVTGTELCHFEVEREDTAGKAYIAGFVARGTQVMVALTSALGTLARVEVRDVRSGACLRSVRVHTHLSIFNLRMRVLDVSETTARVLHPDTDDDAELYGLDFVVSDLVSGARLGVLKGSETSGLNVTLDERDACVVTADGQRRSFPKLERIDRKDAAVESKLLLTLGSADRGRLAALHRDSWPWSDLGPDDALRLLLVPSLRAPRRVCTLDTTVPFGALGGTRAEYVNVVCNWRFAVVCTDRAACVIDFQTP